MSNFSCHLNFYRVSVGIMKIAFFSTIPFEKRLFTQYNDHFGHELLFIEAHLNSITVDLAHNIPVVCAFVNDQLDKSIELSIKGHDRDKESYLMELLGSMMSTGNTSIQ
jgi:hypothetical protein